MIKTFTAYTHEIDDVEAAVAEVREQLDLEGANSLMKSTVGIVSCFSEFVDTGVYRALCDALPFEIIGTTTIANTVRAEIGEAMLTLMVITSDELAFATSLSEAIPGEDKAVVEAAYQAAFGKLGKKPSLMLSFVPLLNNFGTDFYVENMREMSQDVPNFGTLAVDHTPDYHTSSVLYGGEAWRDRLAILLIEGPIEPVFYVGSISSERVFREKGVVTGSEGNQLRTVDGKPMVDFLLSLGLTREADGSITGINSFPIIIDYNDGTTPVARAMFAVTPQGHAVCGGNIPEGATLSIGAFDPEEILTTTNRTLESALEGKRHSAMLMYSCVGRYFAQGYDSTAEFRKLQEHMEGGETAFMAAYSGGEICPVYDQAGHVVSRNHNNTFIICAF